MDSNLHCAKIYLVSLRLLLRRTLHIWVIVSALQHGSLGWLSIAACVALLFFMLFDLVLVKAALSSLIFIHLSVVFALLDFGIEAGVKGLHISGIFPSHGLLGQVSSFALWAYFSFFCFTLLALAVTTCILLSRRSSPNKRETLPMQAPG